MVTKFVTMLLRNLFSHIPLDEITNLLSLLIHRVCFGQVDVYGYEFRSFEGSSDAGMGSAIA